MKVKPCLIKLQKLIPAPHKTAAEKPTERSCQTFSPDCNREKSCAPGHVRMHKKTPIFTINK